MSYSLGTYRRDCERKFIIRCSTIFVKLALGVVFHVEIQTAWISIRDDFVEISLGSARSLSEEVLVRIKVREMFDHFASPTLESIQSYLKTAGKALVSHSMLIRGDSQCVWSTINALPPTNRLHKHPPTCMEEHRRLVMNLENKHVEFCRQHVPGAIHFLFRIHCGLVIVSRGGSGWRHYPA